ncbi:CBS domain-containing protein [Pelagibacterium xiamenense]|uniref:CBS domain-containing protein n=1 Tax=Pelagibacterium xiamenense TaxID=2901140 RepID=UPI001E5AC2F9|nr:CBS domain-containing protein [Pelagibacterium xiamenense]MCD7060251.1 CBS domain-containing protein [Pelagibacterium xiamenense]
MFVENILAEKGHDAFTVPARSTVAELVATLAKHNIGAVLVVDDTGSLSGIISERDVVRQLARTEEGLMARTVASIMTKNPQTCAPTDTLDTVMAKMTHGRFRHLPVMDNGKLVGVVSIGDVVKRKIEEAEQEAGALREYIAS